MAYGPAPIKIDWEQFFKLVSYQCTQPEIAAFFNCSVDTIERACKRELGESLAEIWAKREFAGRVRLRKLQFEHAEKHWQMAIYLGKVILGQRDSDPKDVTPLPNPQIIESVASKKKTFEQFCIDAKYPRPFPKQIEMKEFSITTDDPRLLLGARGYGKTDYVTIMGVAYGIYEDWFDNGEDMTESTLIITKSKTRNSAIIEEIANALIANGVELEKQNSSVIRVQAYRGKDHNVEAITIKSSFRGRHPKRLLMDDPVTEEDVSEAMRELVKRKYNEAYKLCKNLVIIGQPAHAFDLYADLRPILKKFEVPHGTIQQLDADLEAMKLAGIDPHSIEMSYHLRIPKTGTVIFSDLKFLDKFIPDDSVAFIDPSDGGDYTAVSIVKGHFDGIAVKGGAWKRAWYHCLDEIIPMLIECKVKKLCFETNATGTQPIEQLKAMLSKYKIGVVGKHSSTSKFSRIQAAGLYASKIYLCKDSMPEYTNQVTRYESNSKFDDSPDSLATCMEWIGLIRGKI